MQLTSADFSHQSRIPEPFTFCAPDPKSHVRMSANRNPGLSWSALPAGTRSLVLLCVDPDVPTKPDDVNKEGRTVPASLPRTNFYHWTMVDIAPSVAQIAAGSCSNGVTPRGKRSPPGPAGSRQGLNDYTDWFANDKDMSGKALRDRREQDVRVGASRGSSHATNGWPGMATLGRSRSRNAQRSGFTAFPKSLPRQPA